MIEWLILFWVSGMVWSECKQLWEEGLKAYVRQWWNWLDFIMLQWPNNDPTLIAEGVFAVANVFSFARIIYLFQTNPHLGPLQISLGCMIIDIAKFLFIFFLVLTSFACGLNQLYWYYDSNTDIDASYMSLLWSLFGQIPAIKELGRGGQQNFTLWVGQALLGAYLIMAVTVMINMLIAMMSRSFQIVEVQHLDVTFATLFWSLFGISSPKSTELVEAHPFVEFVGQGLFMAYHVLSIIVLINMLIAMMSSSFQIIEDHADQEWKFARSKLWMSYFDEGCTLPPPFNVIISPKSVYYFLRGVQQLLLRLYSRPKSPRAPPPPPNPSQAQYNEVMRRLVTRYIHKMKKQCRQDGVNEDDLLEIKQDISSL
ncbi:hypothetical protein B566_EDAN013666, partial [Ephemera danica]